MCNDNINITCNFHSNILFSMVKFLINILEKFFSSNRHFGNIRTKHEMSAPLEWKESFWDKLKKDKLFSPIDLHNRENFKEIRIKIGKKFVVLAINIFLLSFTFNIIKDSYNIIRADYLLLSSSKIDFSKDLPESLKKEEQNKIQSLDNYVKRKDISSIAKTTAELSIYAKWKEYLINDRKQKFIQENENAIKSNLFSFLNNLFILYLILKKKITRQQ